MSMEYFIRDLTALAKYLSLSRVHLYRVLKHCPLPDSCYNQFSHHKGRRIKKTYGYDKIYVLRNSDIRILLHKIIASSYSREPLVLRAQRLLSDL